MICNLREHLLSRGLDPDRYNVILDEENMTATFLLYTLTGKLMGYQHYKPLAPKKRTKDLRPKDLKYFTHSLHDAPVVFGSESYAAGSGPLYLVEGVFDAVALHNLGLRAFAVLCNNPQELKPFLSCLPVPVYAVVDGDDAGMTLASIADAVYFCPPGEDPSSMSREELEKLLC